MISGVGREAGQTHNSSATTQHRDGADRTSSFYLGLKRMLNLHIERYVLEIHLVADAQTVHVLRNDALFVGLDQQLEPAEHAVGAYRRVRPHSVLTVC